MNEREVDDISLFHFHMTQISRAAEQSAIASAAYRAGEKLHSDYYGEGSDYTAKHGVLHSEILLPSHAPERLRDRETLWNEVEKTERRKDAQLAYSFDIALQNELSFEENLGQHRANGLLSRKSIPTMNHDRDTPLKCLHVRTDSSRQTWSVSQNQIRKCE